MTTNNEIDIDPMGDGTVRCTLSGDIAKAIIEKFAAYQKLLEEVKQLRAKVDLLTAPRGPGEVYPL